MRACVCMCVRARARACGAGSRARTRFCIQCGTSSHVLSARSSTGCTTVRRDVNADSKPHSACHFTVTVEGSHERMQKRPAQAALAIVHGACSRRHATCNLWRALYHSETGRRYCSVHTRPDASDRTLFHAPTHAEGRTHAQGWVGRKGTRNYLRGLDCVAEEVELVDQPALLPELLHGHKTANASRACRSLATASRPL